MDIIPDPTEEEIREFNLTVNVGRNGGDRLSAHCTIMAFVQKLTGTDEYEIIAATAHILRLVERLSDTKPGDLEASVDKFLQDNKEYLEYMFQPQVTSYVLYLNFVMFHNFVEPGGGEVPKWKPLTTCNVSSPATKIDPSRDVRLESKNLSAEEEASKVTEKWARL